MVDSFSYNPERDMPPQVYEPGSQQEAEKSEVSYEVVEHVPESYSDSPNNFALEEKFRMNGPEKTIVIVGDEIVYTGSQLTSEDVAGLTVKPSERQEYARYGGGDVLQVKAIKEGERTIAFATDREWAELYIAQFKREVT